MNTVLKKAKWPLSLFLFAVLLGYCIYITGNLFDLKQKGEINKNYLNYPENTFDVIFIGPSTIKNAIYPMQLWEEYGIVSYNLGCGNQAISNSYYLAKEAIRKHHPKLLVLDTIIVPMKNTYLNNQHLHYVTDNMGIFSREKYELIDDIVPGTDKLEFVFPFTVYHSRWTELNKADFTYDYEDEKYSYGALIHAHSSELLPFDIVNSGETLPIPEISKKYLQMIIDLCEENDVELLLTAMPIHAAGSNGVLGDLKSAQMIYNSVGQLADEQSIDFINFIPQIDDKEIGLDRTKDFDGSLHLNIWGAEKMTHYLGNYIQQNYGIADQRTNKKYSFMNDDLPLFKQYKLEQGLKTSTEIFSHIQLLKETEKDNRYTICISVRDTPGAALNSSLASAIQELGLKENLEGQHWHSYIAIIDSGQVVYEYLNPTESVQSVYNGNVDGIDVSITSAPLSDGNQAKIMLDGVDYAINSRGLNIVVYDKSSNTVIDSAVFDTHTKEFTSKHKSF